MKKDLLTYAFLSLRDKLHLTALRLLKDDEDARDAVQDAFFNLWRSGSVSTDAEARNKLFAVLRNLCIDRLRTPQHITLSDAVKSATTVQPDADIDMSAMGKLLSRGLSDTQMEIYTCVVHYGMEYEDIAARLGMTVEAVRVNMSRARKKIKDNYNKFYK